MTTSLIDALRKTVQDSGLSDNALAKLIHVSQPTISRFRAGNDIKFSVAAKLAEHFGLELQPEKKPAKKK
ncbi:MAG: helix-turn-helix domain-containing protein [Pirellulaceae bacterium]